jgi:hypothetical protein
METSNKTIIIPKQYNTGDIFYFQINNKYYFIQIINIIHETRLWPDPHYVYFIALFEKYYKTIPNSIENIDLTNIYEIKFKPKKTLLYFFINNRNHEISMNDFEDADYDKYKNIKVYYYGNLKISSSFNPNIIIPQKMPIDHTENAKGIQVTPLGARFSFLYSRIEQDELFRENKSKKVKTIYFKNWLGDIDPDIIICMESIFVRLYGYIHHDFFMKELKKSIYKINKLDNKYGFITTIEVEDLFDKFSIMLNHDPVIKEKALELIDATRDW